ncbi:MAG: GatB/YqeY domain-containing protein, partial [Firmicutes bacterium]|nr:GatB/YqeY domain-containing protein [Bacillota bacterium]
DFEKAGRTDLADAYRAEMEVLTAYLPQQLSADEIAKIVKETAEAMGIDGGKQNMGKLMGAVMGKVKGVADGGEVKKAVEAFLS